ncbi:targeting protein for Xklp2 [Elysia marginata]|uniref:Targeting protein for Xklp2 n=1 Tax=Elysia marginata TaxID=1093978 RepID=A0AAV4JFL7_9GAST|nr:targeting protein for Xklp2 [Elysia marginata]
MGRWQSQACNLETGNSEGKGILLLSHQRLALFSRRINLGNSTRNLQIDDFQLNTDIRAASREQYDQHLKQREATLEAIKRQRLERQEEEEKAAIMKMRKEAIHIATGIKKYKPQVIKPSDMPLTQAQTPKFSDRFRARLHSQ